MQTAAATGTAAAFGGFAAARSRQAQTFQLGARTDGWRGQAPDAIAEQVNPTLELEVGQTYVVEWTNLDGASHDFAILDADGNELESTEIMNDQGETLTLEFEATEEMAEYYCSVHPATMRGDIELAGEEGPEPEQQLLIEPGPMIGLETVAEGLTAPVDFQVAPEDQDRRFIVDQPGQIYVHGPDGLQDEPFLDISDRIVQLGTQNGEGFDERGLLGLAFHPDFADNGRFFVRYSGFRGTVTPATYSHTFVLSEFQATDDLSSGNPDSERRLLEIPEPQFNHDAGPIAFGPDGYLYVTVGDGGGADDNGIGHTVDWYGGNTGGNAQNTIHTLLGGMLRIDVDNEQLGKPYAIPGDNPFADTIDSEEEEEDKEGDEDGDGATVQVGTNPDLGEHLVDSEGMTLYMFDQDTQGEGSSTCTGDCAEAWPPLTVDGEPSAGEGVQAELTTFEREDGSMQVAANGWPLYYFVNDEAAGDVNGQGVEGFGDMWWVLGPDGSPIRQQDDDGDGKAQQPESPIDTPGLAEYYAWGMRNPWGMSFTEDGELLVADVGQNLLETINHVEMGGNYSWNVKEGTHCFDTELPGRPPRNCPDSTPNYVRGGEELLDPVIEYPQEYGTQNIGSASVAGDIYTGSVSELQGSYVFADWSATFSEPRARLLVAYPPEGWPDEDALDQSLADQADQDSPIFQEELWQNVWPLDEITVQGEGDLIRDEDRLNRYVLAFGTDADGELYVLTSQRNDPFGESGEVHRIVSADGGGGDGGGDGDGG